MKKYLFIFTIGIFLVKATLRGHCQMPCGIYNDSMVYDKIDQYVETMYKGDTILTNGKFANPWGRNEFVRWVITKEKMTDEIAELLMTYFLQQKIKPDEEDTVDKIKSVHKLMFMLVQIKQNTDRKFVENFNEEWNKFKLMFHVEGYECQIEKLRLRKLEQDKAKQGKEEKKLKELNQQEAHSHDHDHDHEHEHEHSH